MLADYRTQDHTSPLTGVASGPYTGPPRTVDLAALPEGARARLLTAMRDRGAPAPLAFTPAPLSRAALGELLAGELPLGSRLPLFALAALVAIALALGFGRSLMPIWTAPLVAGAFGLMFLFWRASRAARASGGRTVGFRPGVYLFPLDVVDARSTILSITPLGSVRTAALRDRGDGAVLDLAFHDGSTFSFREAGAREAQKLAEGLARSQELLEKLTYGHALDLAIANDPFFALRFDAGFDAAAPRPSVRLRRRIVGGLLLAAAVATGAGAFSIRNGLSDDILWTDAVRWEGWHAYIERTDGRGRHVEDARRLAARAWAESSRATGEERIGAVRPRAPSVAPGAASLPSATPDDRAAALARFTARAADEAAALRMESLLESRAPLEIAFVGHLDRSLEDAPAAARVQLGHRAQTARHHRVAGALGVAISEAVPRSVLDVREVLAVTPGGPHLLVDETIRWVARGPTSGLEVVYEVTLDVPGRKAGRFALTMPAPDAPVEKVRDRSLFTFSDFGLVTVEGVSSRPFEGTLARDYDRLYDELYGLFFKGDPRVPTSDADEAAQTFGAPMPHP